MNRPRFTKTRLQGLIALLKAVTKQIDLHLFTFVGLICFAHLVFFQRPLLIYATSVSDYDLNGFTQILSLQFLQFFLLGCILLMVASISTVLLKAVSTVLFLTNATALYFMLTYGVELDLSMIGNILDTDTREASELWHWSIGGYLFLFGVIPSVLVWQTRLTTPRRHKTMLGAVVMLVALFAWLFATSFTWLWYDQHATRMGGRILPWSYVVNTGRHFNRMDLRNREQVLLPTAHFLSETHDKKEIVVLVMGEAARAANFAHYGYPRETNPFTMQTDIAVLPMGLGCATFTIGATACILTHEGRKASPRTTYETIASYLTRHGVETIYRTNSGGTPPVTVDRHESTRAIAAACSGDDCPDGNLDAALNWKLGDILQASSQQRIFVTLHQTGSHGPSYFRRYPPDFAHFTPVCDTVQVAECSEEALYNAYDNTIRYTDYLLADLIAQFKAIPDANIAMIYVSDHGQSLGESGLYLHGMPIAVAPLQQREIPFLVWMSDGFKESRGLSTADIIPAETFPHDFPFHSVMGAFGMRSDIYKPQYDIFADGRN